MLHNLTSDTHYDVVIIGGGPAGNAAAYDLCQAGLKVIILEKQAFPRAKPCAGGLTTKTLHLFRYSVAPVIRRTANTLTISRGTGKQKRLTANMPVCALTVRSELDAFCLQKARDKGAEFDLIPGIRDITEENDGVTLTTRDERRFCCRYLIGADGAHSQVRKLTQQFKPNHTAVAIEATVPLAKIGEMPGFTLDLGVLKKGYGWLFPKHDHVNIGIYNYRPDKLPITKSLLRGYAQTRLGTAELDNIAGYPVGTGGENYTPSSERVFLTGDAAGMAEPVFGEGIHNAIKSGQAAATAIIQAQDQATSALQAFIAASHEIKCDMKDSQLVFRALYGFLPFSVFLIKHYPVKQIAMNGCAEGLTVTECKRRFFRYGDCPEKGTPLSLKELSLAEDS